MNDLILILLQSTETPKMSDENWWLAFAPIVIVAIIFTVIVQAFRAILRGNRSVGKIFRLSEKEQADMMRRAREKSREYAMQKKQSSELGNK